MALCPYCKKEVTGENIVRDKIDDGETVRNSLASIKNMDVHTTMFCCPSCQTILGFAQHLSYSNSPQKREISFI